MRSISGSVGQNGKNVAADVITVQDLLNRVPNDEGGPLVPLEVDGLAWGKTIAAIKRFQSMSLGHKWPDGRVDPGGKTFTRLSDYDAPGPAGEPESNPRYVWYVPGKKTILGQPSDNTCWATDYTMMRSWREGKKLEIEEALEKPGKTYVEMFKKDRNLLPRQFREFWARGGLTVRGQASFADHIWFDFLRTHGLLVVGTANAIAPKAGLHLRIMEGMSCCGEPSDCYAFIDPAFGGTRYPESRFVFESKYNLAMSIAGGSHWQVAHYW